jgi:hypothetical protein
MHPILQRKLREVVDARRQVRLLWGYAILLAVAGVVAWGAWWGFDFTGETYARLLLWLAGGLLIGALVVKLWSWRVRLNFQQVARMVEAEHPELHSMLLTAIEQKPGAQGFGYLQERLVNEVVREAVRHQWDQEITQRSHKAATWARAASLVMLACGMLFLSYKTFLKPLLAKPEIAATEVAKAVEKPASTYTVEVTPGDTEIEKGSRLVVEAKFAQDVPPDAVLVVSDANGAERQRLPMKPTVDAKVFGGMVGNVRDDGLYRVEFDGHKSKDFKITTFVYPELVSADATVTPPSYSGQPAKTVKNTQKVTLMEGSQLTYRLKLNKPVKDAEFFADKDHLISLKATQEDASIVEATWIPDETRKYRLHLVDAQERASKQTPQFTISVLANSLPKIEVAFPKRDARVSPLQEMPLEAKLWDDVGVQKAGAVIELAEAQREVLLPIGKSEPGKKMDVRASLNLEPEKVEPLQLVSYYFWAEDRGPKGETRRAMSDMFFAEVRHFEDIMREMEPPPGEPGKPGQADELVKLQKDIVNANWRLIRDRNAGKLMPVMKPDVDTVLVSQGIASDKLVEALEKVENPQVKAALLGAQQEMKNAEKTLGVASDSLDEKAMREALKPEQAALRWLFKAQSNERNITKANSKSKGQGASKEQELTDLELKQKEQRYEEDKQAGEEQTAEQQENLAVLNRLKELARRQEALAEKMKQLEQQLAQSKSEDEKEELANQLKRLQDEQDQLLRDLDDLKERMEKPENAANMAEAKQQLEDTREKVAEAAEKLKEDKLAQASTAATRAQKELEKARDDFRQRTARRFGEEMKAMRDEARQLAQEQQKLADALEKNPAQGDAKNPNDTSDALKQQLSAAQTARQAEAQRERAGKLMEDMKRLSEQAEGSEPLLHKHLYDAVRQAQAQGLEENLEEAGAQARYGDRTAALDASNKATKSVEQLKTGIEKAAESVLGNENEALRMARNELDKLIDEAKGGEGKKSEVRSEKSEKGAVGEKPTAPAGQKPGDQEGHGEKGLAQDKGEPKPSGQGKGDGQKPGEQPGKGMAQNEGEPQAGELGQGDKPGEQGRGQRTPRPESGTADASSARGLGDKPGEKGEGKGDQPGQPSESGEGQGQMANAEGQGQGEELGDKGQGKGQQTAANDQSGQPSERGQASSQRAGGRRDARRGGSNSDGGGDEGGWFFDAGTEVADASPITGSNFDNWSDRLRNVEDMLTRPELRNEVAKVLDHARDLRADARRNDAVPQVEHLQMRILNPLVELRDKVTEELARKEGKNPLAPVDRDPVPEQYRELVQKYYEQLGAGK